MTLTRNCPIFLGPSSQIQVAPPFSSMSLQHGMTSKACSGLSRKWVKKSPSTCQRPSSFGGVFLPSVSGLPKLTMKPSVHISPPLAIRSSPPHSSQMATHVFGAISLAGTTLSFAMWLRSVVQVDLSFGSMPSRCQTSLLHRSQFSIGMAPGIRKNPYFMKD